MTDLFFNDIFYGVYCCYQVFVTCYDNCKFGFLEIRLWSTLAIAGKYILMICNVNWLGLFNGHNFVFSSMFHEFTILKASGSCLNLYPMLFFAIYHPF
jgi:hypothetical protein